MEIQNRHRNLTTGCGRTGIICFLEAPYFFLVLPIFLGAPLFLCASDSSWCALSFSWCSLFVFECPLCFFLVLPMFLGAPFFVALPNLVVLPLSLPLYLCCWCSLFFGASSINWCCLIFLECSLFLSGRSLFFWCPLVVLSAPYFLGAPWFLSLGAPCFFSVLPNYLVLLFPSVLRILS